MDLVITLFPSSFQKLLYTCVLVSRTLLCLNVWIDVHVYKSTLYTLVCNAGKSRNRTECTASHTCADCAHNVMSAALLLVAAAAAHRKTIIPTKKERSES